MPDTNKKVSNITFKNQFWFTFCNCFFYLILIEIYKIPYLFRRKWMQRLKCRLEICTWMTCLICFDIEISISRKKNLPPYWLLIRTCFNLATCWWKTCREFHEKFLYRGPKALTFTIQLKIARLRRIEIFFRDYNFRKLADGRFSIYVCSEIALKVLISETILTTPRSTKYT